MRLRTSSRALGVVVFGAAAAGIAVASAACSVVVGAGDYHVVSTASDAGDASEEREASGEASACPGVVLPEASACVPVTTGTLPPGGGACLEDSEGSACYPHDTSGLAPTWTPTMGPHLGVCNSEQISAFYTACEDTSSTTTTCNAWKNAAANSACFGCLYTPSTASSYGALVYYVNNELDEVNAFGCIALSEPCNQSCGAAMLAQLECENASCSSPYCTSFDDYQTCSSEADNCTACQDLVNTSQNCQAELTNDPTNHPSVDTCNLNATSFQDFYTAIATYICGC